MSKHENNQQDELWPSKSYFQQVEVLYRHIGDDIYIVPVLESKTRLTFSISGLPVTLIDIIVYPKPDPEQHLYPHMLILSDGTGINLGKILKISKNTAFNPCESDVLYQDKVLQNTLMYAPRTLNSDTIGYISRYALANLLGKSEVSELNEHYINNNNQLIRNK